MPRRMHRRTWLLALPVLVGALLLMHGLDARAGDSHALGGAVSAAMGEHPHDESTPAEHAHCLECLAGHVMAACLAIISTIGSVGVARRLRARPGPPVAPAAVAGRLRRLVALARPPDPAWVRLSVMRC